jgi:hypothetical protein
MVYIVSQSLAGPVSWVVGRGIVASSQLCAELGLCPEELESTMHLNKHWEAGVHHTWHWDVSQRSEREVNGRACSCITLDWGVLISRSSSITDSHKEDRPRGQTGLIPLNRHTFTARGRGHDHGIGYILLLSAADVPPQCLVHEGLEISARRLNRPRLIVFSHSKQSLTEFNLVVRSQRFYTTE